MGFCLLRVMLLRVNVLADMFCAALMRRCSLGEISRWWAADRARIPSCRRDSLRERAAPACLGDERAGFKTLLDALMLVDVARGLLDWSCSVVCAKAGRAEAPWRGRTGKEGLRKNSSQDLFVDKRAQK